VNLGSCNNTLIIIIIVVVVILGVPLVRFLLLLFVSF